MTFIRAIGRWTMTGLVVSCIIGNAIIGLPSEINRLVGRASPLAMGAAALAFSTVMLCLAEVASQFSETGGVYLYVRTAFGRFAAMQAGWFNLLAASASRAANATLFMMYLTVLLPWMGGGKQQYLVLALVISIPTFANIVGVRSGASLSNVLTLAKLLPLALLIIVGLARFYSLVVLLC